MFMQNIARAAYFKYNVYYKYRSMVLTSSIGFQYVTQVRIACTVITARTIHIQGITMYNTWYTMYNTWYTMIFSYVRYYC